MEAVSDHRDTTKHGKFHVVTAGDHAEVRHTLLTIESMLLPCPIFPVSDIDAFEIQNC